MSLQNSVPLCIHRHCVVGRCLTSFILRLLNLDTRVCACILTVEAPVTGGGAVFSACCGISIAIQAHSTPTLSVIEA